MQSLSCAMKIIHLDDPAWVGGFYVDVKQCVLQKTYLILGFSVNLFWIMIYRIIQRDLINQFFSHIFKNLETSLMWVITICHSISPISVDADDDEEEEEDGEDDKDGVEVERVNHLNCWELSTWCRRCCKRHCKYIWVLIYLDYCFSFGIFGSF